MPNTISAVVLADWLGDRPAASRRVGADLWRRSLSAALLLAGLFLPLSDAEARQGLIPRVDQTVPRDVFFNDYFLFSAQADIVAMDAHERVRLATLVDTCDGAILADEARRQRCEVVRLQYLADFRLGRNIDGLLDAVQFMTAMIRYNRTIGRQNELGLDGRLATIHKGLRGALGLAVPGVSPEASLD